MNKQTNKQTPHGAGLGPMIFEKTLELSEDCLDGKVRKIPPAGSWDWEPIECAPKDGREIMLFHPAGGLFLTDLISTGHYDEDRYSKNPRPYWSVDRKFKDLNGLRKNPPKLWARIIPPV